MIILHIIYGIVMVINIIQVVMFIRKKYYNKNTKNKDLSIHKEDKSA